LKIGNRKLLAAPRRRCKVEEKTKPDNDRHSPLWLELHEKAKDDPELAVHLEAAERVIERYRDTLQRLANS
jgi:hypothetical protein